MESSTWILCGYLLAGALLLGVNLVPLFALLARKIDFVDRPGGIKTHARPIPYGGGVSVGLSLLVPLVFLLHPAFENLEGLPEGWKAELREGAPRVFLVLAGGAGFLLIGLLDDVRKLSPYTRLAAEAIIALAISIWVGHLGLFLEQSGVAGAVRHVATVLWIVGVANTFNLLDHFDGICSGFTLVTGFFLLLIALMTDQAVPAVLLSALVGATGAFFVFNFPPAKVFLGDAGSLFLGYLLAVVSVLVTFYREPGPPYPYLLPWVLLAIPLFDTGRVVFVRIREGRPIFSGDRCHIAHRLNDLGLPPRRVVGFVLGLAIVSGLGGVILYHANKTGAVLALVQTWMTLALLALLARPR